MAAASEFALSAASRAPDAPQDFGVATKLLVEKRNRPAARHPVAQSLIDRLERVVPIAVPVAQQMRAGNEALAHRCDQFGDVGRDRIAMGGLFEIVLAPPRDGFVEEGEIAGRFDVIAQGLQRPDDDVAMRLRVVDRG